jgi:hypothetical protein
MDSDKRPLRRRRRTFWKNPLKQRQAGRAAAKKAIAAPPGQIPDAIQIHTHRLAESRAASIQHWPSFQAVGRLSVCLSNTPKLWYGPYRVSQRMKGAAK